MVCTPGHYPWQAHVVCVFLCGKVGLAIRVHLLLGGVRSVTTALKVVEEVQEEVQEIEDEWGDEEIGWNGELKVEENAHFMYGHEMRAQSQT